jgi:adenine-specific DNA-methyltransferase
MCRNNIGNWEIRSIAAGSRERNAQFYAAKDRVMAQEATIGLMIWDGKSIGTLLNVFRLLSLQKKAVLYTVPEKTFREFKQCAEWEDFLAHYDSGLQREVEKRVRLETPANNVPLQTSLLG